MSTDLQLTFQPPTIPEFYSGKTVAITGGTGFVGHTVIEKLLRCCPGIKKIFVLLRKKRNVDAVDRVAQLVKLPIFDQLKTIQPGFEDKIIPVYCNLEEDGLGLDDSSVELIQNEVNIFIHSAATLRFDEHLKLACQLNTLAVRSILNLCRGILNLEALVHVSTAYSYCNRKIIGDEVYQTGWDFDKLHDAMQWMTDDMITKLTPDILRERPNTYTLTKAFGEEIIVKEGDGLPICIVRPSIIGASYEEPVPGWCSNFNGATGIIVAVGKGMLHTLPSPKSLNLDVIPVDFVVNSIIAAGWKTGLSRQSPKLIIGTPEEEDSNNFSKIDTIARSLHCIPETDSALTHLRRKTIPIYQVVVGKDNITMKDWTDLVCRHFKSHPFDSVFQVPYMQLQENKRLHRLLSFVLDYLPAYLVEMGMNMLRVKSKMLWYNQKISSNVTALDRFITQDWEWEGNGLKELNAKMSKEDREVFNVFTQSVDWNKYILNYVLGSKKYVVKEKNQSYEFARRKLWRLRMAGYAMQALFLILVWRLLVSRTAIAQNLWHLVLSLLFKFVNFFQLSSALQKFRLIRFK